jgi:protocatechuate 3,4-dioxygenase beta subunit
MRRLLCALVIVLSAASLTSQAQSPSPRDPLRSIALSGPKTGTGRISGRVSSAETGDPLRNARVTISPAEGVPIVLTDGDGRFIFAGLPEGTYSFSASKSGYADSARARSGRPGVVQLGDGAVVGGVTIVLERGAAIAGRVVDDLGEPVSSATLYIEQLAEAGGSRTTRERRTVQTNDAGEYRVGSLPAGDYVVSRLAPAPVQIVVNNGNAVAFQPPLQGGPSAARADLGPPRIFFPDAATLSEAETITLKAGEERLSVDLIGPRAQVAMIDLARGLDQTPVARDPAAKSTSAIRGRILGPTGPLVEAEVRVSGDAIRPLPPVFTDALGQYEFVNLPAGTYGLIARKNRYVARAFGQQATSDRGTPIVLGNDEALDRADITLPRTSVLSGQLTDEYGEPVEGVTIRLHQIRFVSGQRRLVDVSGPSGSRTDDRGRYRIFRLQPGSYVVAAYVGQLLVFGQQEVADIPGYATTYFPGTSNAPDLRLVPVPASQDLEGVDFSLARTSTAAISGVAQTSAGEPITGGLVLNSSRRSGAVATTPVGARIEPDGSFEFRNVPPGRYVIQASRGRLKSSLESEFAAVPVTVNGADIKGLVVQTSPGSTISGRFTFASANTPASRNLDLSAVPADADLAPPDGSVARADVHDDWTFEMGGISGPRRLRLLRAPRGWGLKQILVDGVDATDAPLPFGAANQSLRDVEVVLTDQLTEVTGTVTDDRNRPVPDARVVVFSTDPDLWYDRSRFMKITASGADGAFAVRDLPPGVYFVAAVDRLRASEENGEWLNPELLGTLAVAASRVTLAEGQKVSTSPRLAPR